MKLNTKIRYGVRTMIELALDYNGKGLFQKDISERQNISYKYLDHIISALKARGLISNVDGKKSGYRLSRLPEEITIYDVYKAFEPELLIVDCLTVDGQCANEKACAAQQLWFGLNTIIIDYLKSQTLKELAEKQQKLNNEQADAMFVI
jgi:Rrf2 family protein